MADNMSSVEGVRQKLQRFSERKMGTGDIDKQGKCGMGWPGVDVGGDDGNSMINRYRVPII